MRRTLPAQVLADPVGGPVGGPAVAGAGDGACESSAARLPAGSSRGRGPRWERRKADRPNELLQAALEIFVERGFASARLEDVASRAGVSKGTLYLYFTNKEDLFKAVVRRSILPLINDFRSSIEASTLSSGGLLGQYLQAWWSNYGDQAVSGVAKLCVAESGNFPEVARFWRDEVIGANNALVAGILQRGIDSGEFRRVDVDAMVHLIMAPLVLRTLMRDVLDGCCSTTSTLDPQSFIGHHLDMLLHALAAPGPRPGDPT